MSKQSLWKTIFFVCVFCAVAAIGSQAQTHTVLYSFTEVPDGANPFAGLLIDAGGNLYGTTEDGGILPNILGCGTVFKLVPSGNETTRYTFCTAPNLSSDAQSPFAGLIMDAAGNLYGTTRDGGSPGGGGAVFKVDTSGNETILHSFTGSDGLNPEGGLIMDAAGNLYGTTPFGGASGPLNYGTVFKLDTSANETVLHSFIGSDGANPDAGLIMDAAGNLYGTTVAGGQPGGGGDGTVFKLDTFGNLTVLHSFTGSDGAGPYAGLIMDAAGNFYGTTLGGGSGTSSTCNGCGTVFKLDKSGNETVLYSFKGPPEDGFFPYAGLVMDALGDLYGTTRGGGSGTCTGANAVLIGCGTVFKLDTAGNETILHSFTGGSDGAFPRNDGHLVMDALGNLYGTTEQGGTGPCPDVGGLGGCGTVFKVTVPSQVTLSPPSLAFGNQPVTITSAAQSVTLTNSGASPLSISGITSSGDFAETNDCLVAPLAAGAPCMINVTFTPTATGSRTGAVTITDNATNSPQSLPLSGTGTDFSVSASPSTQTLTAGKSTTYTMSVTPISGFTGTVALSCSGAPPAGSCTISPTSVSLNGTITSTATVTTATTGKGKKGTPKSTYTLRLTGRFGTLSHSTQVMLTVK